GAVTNRFGEFNWFRFLVNDSIRSSACSRSGALGASSTRHFIVGIGFDGIAWRSEAVLQVIDVRELQVADAEPLAQLARRSGEGAVPEPLSRPSLRLTRRCGNANLRPPSG